jgi:Caspase domain
MLSKTRRLTGMQNDLASESASLRQLAQISELRKIFWAAPIHVGSFRRIFHLGVCPLLLAVSMAVVSTAAAAKKSALLVGVSEYPGIPGNALQGPGSDVLMIERVLAQLGFQPTDIKILADKIPGAQTPTREAILAEVRQMIDSASSGDIVVIYLSGHGSVQPAKPEDVGVRSLDGLDAIFLPADVRPGAYGMPENVIVNYEIAKWVRDFQETGAFLWLIADSCYSGYIDRDLKSRSTSRDRAVDPEAIGIPREAIESAKARAVAAYKPGMGVSRGLDMPIPDLSSPKDNAPYVGFFAAQSTEKTPEYPMPDENSEVRGLFTYTLSQSILQNPSSSFAQYRDAVLRRYAEMQRNYPTPVAVGTGLDQTMFGNQPAVRQWPMTSESQDLIIKAGELHGLNVGSILSVIDDPLAPDNQARGFVQIYSARPFDSVATPIEYKGSALLKVDAVHNSFARLVEPSVPLVLRVGLPRAGADGKSERITNTLIALQDKIRSADKASAHIQWVDPGQGGADIVLVVEEGYVWFASADGSYVRNGSSKTYSIPLSDDPPALLSAIWDNLQRIARTTNLMRLGSTFSERPPDGLEMDVRVSRKGRDDTEHVMSNRVVEVHAGDKLNLFFTNSGTFAIDLTVLYVDSTYHIYPVFPINGGTPRLAAARGVASIPATFNAGTTGLERLVIIAAQSRPEEAVSDFSFLADATANTGKAIEGGGFTRLLARAGFPQFGAKALSVEPSTSSTNWIQTVTFRVSGNN